MRALHRPPDVEVYGTAWYGLLGARSFHPDGTDRTPEVVHYLVPSRLATGVTRDHGWCKGGAVAYEAEQREATLPTTWWWLRARSRAIGFCHVSACIRHSDLSEFVAYWRDFTKFT